MIYVFFIFYEFFFFFKQKTAYEMRISDWSSDVCSSDLAAAARVLRHRVKPILGHVQVQRTQVDAAEIGQRLHDPGEVAGLVVGLEIGRASCRERVCQYV